MRKDGVRIELEHVSNARSGRQIPVVYNYG